MVFSTFASGSSAIAMEATSTLLTLKGSLKIVNGGNIGSVGDPDAIGISAGGIVSITATTGSSSKTTGALTVAGGVGIGENLHVGGTTTSGASNAGALTVAGGVGIAENLHVGGTLGVAGVATITVDDATNADVTDVLKLVHTTSGTPTNGLGVGMSFKLEDSDNNIQEFGSIDVVSTTITDSS